MGDIRVIKCHYIKCFYVQRSLFLIRVSPRLLSVGITELPPHPPLWHLQSCLDFPLCLLYIQTCLVYTCLNIHSLWFGCSNVKQFCGRSTFLPSCYTSDPSQTWRSEGTRVPAGDPAVSSSVGLISSHTIGGPVIIQAKPLAHMIRLMIYK